jgi:hypothetical protein
MRIRGGEDRALVHFENGQPVRKIARMFEPMRAKLIGRELGVDDLIALLKHD